MDLLHWLSDLFGWDHHHEHPAPVVDPPTTPVTAETDHYTTLAAAPVVPAEPTGNPFLDALDAQMRTAGENYHAALDIAAQAPHPGDVAPGGPAMGLIQADTAWESTMNDIRLHDQVQQTLDTAHQTIQDTDQTLAETEDL